ncbi:hypothetical protein EJ05DRAFT_30244 [Pseudovirgaria hyperparasitica]|uniref:DUF6697 domain-containing protein n=1 Tax=Pseudovirgaria hyperparasitica TaxID=470096 RepID=A0A6A6WM52_9PEZI|nr:uncharacterized protein EJ05DRAFT_30244 [Pseudovirgaria hyperparasitica]KAF2763228.1 hypothetical protein EJ05DRAFT_30244 [Pseudovirgaria hyperparasitica]
MPQSCHVPEPRLIKHSAPHDQDSSTTTRVQEQADSSTIDNPSKMLNSVRDRRDSMLELDQAFKFQLRTRTKNVDNGLSHDGARSELSFTASPTVGPVKPLPPHLRARATKNAEVAQPLTVQAKQPFVPPHLRGRALNKPGTAEPLAAQPVATRPVATEPVSNGKKAFVPPHLRTRTQERPVSVQSTTAAVEPKREDSSETESTYQAPSLDADKPLRSVEDTFIEAVGWRPYYIKSLKNLPEEAISGIPELYSTVTFSWEFLKNTLGGIEWSPGMYYIPTAHGVSILPNRTYCAYDASHEPYLPMRPGEHGAKLTAFFADNPDDEDGDEVGEAAYTEFPLFIQASRYARRGNAASDKYIYFGTYSQSRWSDRLDYDHMINDVPHDVKMHWATKLSEADRPEWVTDKLVRHFWPPPEYKGALPEKLPATGSESGGVEEDDEHYLKVQHDIGEYIKELRYWKIVTPPKVALLSRDLIMEAFERPDAADPPGLRLQWEYLECVGFDRDFYDMLILTMKDRN